MQIQAAMESLKEEIEAKQTIMAVLKGIAGGEKAIDEMLVKKGNLERLTEEARQKYSATVKELDEKTSIAEAQAKERIGNLSKEVADAQAKFQQLLLEHRQTVQVAREEHQSYLAQLRADRKQVEDNLDKRIAAKAKQLEDITAELEKIKAKVA